MSHHREHHILASTIRIASVSFGHICLRFISILDFGVTFISFLSRIRELRIIHDQNFDDWPLAGMVLCLLC